MCDLLVGKIIYKQFQFHLWGEIIYKSGYHAGMVWIYCGCK